MLLRTFVSEPEPGQECRHLNGNRLDNRLENLRWGTVKENAQDRQRHGTQARGEDVYTAKLTEQDVLDIRVRLKQANGSLRHADLAAEYGVHPGTITSVARGEAWDHVGGPDCSGIPKQQGTPPVACSMEQAQQILNKYIAGATQTELAESYGISAATVSYILNRNGAYANLNGPAIQRKHRKGGPKNISREEAEAIRLAYSSDPANTLTVLGKEHSVSIATISSIVRAEGKYSYFGFAVKRPSPPPKPKPEPKEPRYRLIEREEAEEIRAVYASNADNTIRTLAKKHGVSQGTINIILLGKGRYAYFGSAVKRPEKARPRKCSFELAQQIIDRYADGGITQKDLAHQYGLSNTTIQNVLYRRGSFSVLP